MRRQAGQIAPAPSEIVPFVSDPDRSVPSTTPYCWSVLVTSLPLIEKLTSRLTCAAPPPAITYGSILRFAIGNRNLTPATPNVTGCLTPNPTPVCVCDRAPAI